LENFTECKHLLLDRIKPGADRRAIYDAFIGKFGELGLPAIDFVGHGIGLHLHEKPYLGRYSEGVLEEGMVLAIEPLVYGRGMGFGLQNKDMLVVTAGGCELLSDRTNTDCLVRVGSARSWASVPSCGRAPPAGSFSARPWEQGATTPTTAGSGGCRLQLEHVPIAWNPVPVIRQWRLQLPGYGHAGTNLDGPTAADRGRGWAGKFDPRGGAPLCGEPVGRDQADAAAAAGASILYLPPYSPDLNPIEQLFAKLKALLRKAAARTRDALWSTLGRLLEAVPETECANYLSHCGYGAT
jgi:Metallopeptidase family M24/DDE superfamily endonuclease